MNEFELIKHYFHELSNQDKNVVVGIGDDAAVLDIPKGYQLLVSTDTLVYGVHFLKSDHAFDIAYKSLMVNISDIVAMGGTPKWATLSLTLPDNDDSWLQAFSNGLKKGLDDYSLSLIGGDTTKGSLSITISLLGIVPYNKAIKRQGAKENDIIMVSGDLGGAALAISKDLKFNNKDKEILQRKLLHPMPNVKLGQALIDKANSAIDISDGLSQDLGHILNASNLGATIELHQIPTHPLVKKYKLKKVYELALFGGDDYELCFTVPSIEAANYFSEKFNATKIGIIEKKPGLRGIDDKGQIHDIEIKGYNHFRS